MLDGDNYLLAIEEETHHKHKIYDARDQKVQINRKDVDYHYSTKNWALKSINKYKGEHVVHDS